LAQDLACQMEEWQHQMRGFIEINFACHRSKNLNNKSSEKVDDLTFIWCGIRGMIVNVYLQLDRTTRTPQTLLITAASYKLFCKKNHLK